MQRRKNYRKGKGIINYLKNKIWSANDYLKEKKFVHKIRDIPLLGWALNLWGIPGMAAWGLDKLGYGKRKKKKGKGRHRRVGRPKKN